MSQFWPIAGYLKPMLQVFHFFLVSAVVLHRSWCFDSCFLYFLQTLFIHLHKFDWSVYHNSFCMAATCKHAIVTHSTIHWHFEHHCIYRPSVARISDTAVWRSRRHSTSRLIGLDFVLPFRVRSVTPAELPLTIACVSSTPACFIGRPFESSLAAFMMVKPMLTMFDCTRFIMFTLSRYCGLCPFSCWEWKPIPHSQYKYYLK